MHCSISFWCFNFTHSMALMDRIFLYLLRSMWMMIEGTVVLVKKVLAVYTRFDLFPSLGVRLGASVMQTSNCFYCCCYKTTNRGRWFDCNSLGHVQQRKHRHRCNNLSAPSCIGRKEMALHFEVFLGYWLINSDLVLIGFYLRNPLREFDSRS